MKLITHAFMILSAFLFVAAEAAEMQPGNMTEANKVCPSEELCPKIEREYQECNKDPKSTTGREFLQTFKKLLPTYDCRRHFDNDAVPAVWLCEGQRGDGKRNELEDYAVHLPRFDGHLE